MKRYASIFLSGVLTLGSAYPAERIQPGHEQEPQRTHIQYPRHTGSILNTIIYNEDGEKVVSNESGYWPGKTSHSEEDNPDLWKMFALFNACFSDTEINYQDRHGNPLGKGPMPNVTSAVKYISEAIKPMLEGFKDCYNGNLNLEKMIKDYGRNDTRVAEKEREAMSCWQGLSYPPQLLEHVDWVNPGQVPKPLQHDDWGLVLGCGESLDSISPFRVTGECSNTIFGAYQIGDELRKAIYSKKD